MALNGAITSTDVLAHPLLIARLFGIPCLLRCLRAIILRQRVTFLSLI